MRSLMIRAWWLLQGIMNSSINWKCWQYSIKRPTGRSWTCSSSWICSLNNGVIWIEMTRLWWVSDISNNLWNFSQFYFLYHTVFWGDTGRIRYGSLFKKFFKKNIFSTNVAGATQASFFPALLPSLHYQKMWCVAIKLIQPAIYISIRAAFSFWLLFWTRTGVENSWKKKKNKLKRETERENKVHQQKWPTVWHTTPCEKKWFFYLHGHNVKYFRMIMCVGSLSCYLIFSALIYFFLISIK